MRKTGFSGKIVRGKGLKNIQAQKIPGYILKNDTGYNCFVTVVCIIFLINNAKNYCYVLQVLNICFIKFYI